ncbi:MAG: hypothetical protein ACLQBA_24245 [Candidatus Binataceae bacterium]
MVVIDRANESAEFAHQIARTAEFFKQFDGFSAKRARLLHAHWGLRHLIANSPRQEDNQVCVSLPHMSCTAGFKNGIAVAQGFSG